MIAAAAIPTPTLVFGPVLPELILAVAAMIGLLYEALAPRSDRTVHLAIGLAGLVGGGRERPGPVELARATPRSWAGWSTRTASR